MPRLAVCHRASGLCLRKKRGKMPGESQPSVASVAAKPNPPHILLGITSAQTAMVLAGRVRSLIDAGFRVSVLSSPGEHLDRLVEAEGGEAVRIPMARAIAPLRDVVALFRIARVLRRLRPDIVEFSTPKAGLLGTLAALLAGVPRRVYLLRGLKLETARGPKRTLLWSAEWLAMRAAGVVLSNSASLRENALALRLTRPSKICVLGAGSGIGVDTTHFAPGSDALRYRLGLPCDAKVVGFVGRLTRDKGLPELVEAFDRILRRERRAWLLLVGWWDEAEDAIGAELRRRVQQHPRIVVTGFVRDPAPHYRAMDVFVLPTWREGFPNAVLEASATGLPVVTTFSTGARDAVLPEVTGLLTPAGRPEKIEEAVLRLLRDASLRERMGQAGRRWVAAEFDRRQVLARNAAFYRALLEGNMEQGGAASWVENAPAPVPEAMDWSA